MLVLGSTLGVGLYLAVPVGVVTSWAIGDVLSRPPAAFGATGLSKATWLVLLTVLTFVTGFLGLGLAINYLCFARRTVKAAGAGEVMWWGVVAKSVVPLALACLATFQIYQLAEGVPKTAEPIALFQGHLSGSCVASRVSVDGERYTVTLTSSRGRAADRAVLAGWSHERTFAFEVTPGNWTVTATSGHIVRRWHLVYGDSVLPTIQPVPYPVAMDASVPVNCARAGGQ